MFIFYKFHYTHLPLKFYFLQFSGYVARNICLYLSYILISVSACIFISQPVRFHRAGTSACMFLHNSSCGPVDLEGGGVGAPFVVTLRAGVVAVRLDRKHGAHCDFTDTRQGQRRAAGVCGGVGGVWGCIGVCNGWGVVCVCWEYVRL